MTTANSTLSDLATISAKQQDRQVLRGRLHFCGRHLAWVLPSIDAHGSSECAPLGDQYRSRIFSHETAQSYSSVSGIERYCWGGSIFGRRHLAGLDLCEAVDGRQTAIFCQRQRHHVQSVGESVHRILLYARIPVQGRTAHPTSELGVPWLCVVSQVPLSAIQSIDVCPPRRHLIRQI